MKLRPRKSKRNIDSAESKVEEKSDASTPSPSPAKKIKRAEKGEKKWLQPVRWDKHQTLTEREVDLLTVSMDIAEEHNDIRIVELIRITTEFPSEDELALGCDHHHYQHQAENSVFWCPGCGIMAETVPHKWPSVEKYNDCLPRLEALVGDYMTKPIQKPEPQTWPLKRLGPKP